MPIRRLALALCLALLAAGCTTQRDSTDVDADTNEEGDVAEEDTETTRGGMPNVPAYLDGAWDFTATQVDGDEAFTGTLTIAEAEGASRVLTSTGIDAPLAIEGMEVTNDTFVLDGTLQTPEGPVSVNLAGSLSGDEMSAEADVEGLGTFAITGTRQSE
jgi:hypothetical protein